MSHLAWCKRQLKNNIILFLSLSLSLSLLQAAGGGVSMGPRGAYVPPLDKLEVGLELVGEAASLSGLTLGQDISVVVDIGADRLFDQVCVSVSVCECLFVCRVLFVRRMW